VTVAQTAAELFAPELALGYDALDSELRDRLRGYLAEVIRARRFPVHTTVAWNALHFGFDPEEGSYDEVLLAAQMPTVNVGERGPALPVGALAWVTLGAETVWAEVVAKDGRPPGVDPATGVAPVELAGRPADRIDAPVPGTDERHVVALVSEALICDFEPFGRIDGLDRRLNRLERRGKLAPHRLINVDAIYDPPEGAEDTDTWFYARWLFDMQRELLAAGPLAAGLADSSDEALRAGLLASLGTVDVLLSSIPGVVRWGDFALLAAWVDEIDLTPNLWMHRSDIEHLMVTMFSSRDGEATLTALVPRIESDIGLPTSPAERPDAVVADPLRGLDYLRVVARTGRWLADRLDETGGIVDARGVERLLRVDDLWPWGGLWRSDPYGPRHPLIGIPTDEPFGIGWWGWRPLAEYLELTLEDVTTAVAAALAAPTTPPDDAPGEEKAEQAAAEEEERQAQPADAEEPAPIDEPGNEEREEPADIASTMVQAITTLRQVDLDTMALPLPDRFGWLANGEAVTVRINHPGDLDTDLVVQTAKGALDGGLRRLEPVEWPLDFFPGIRLHLASFTGARTLFAMTVPLGDHGPYPYAFDPAVVGRPASDGELTLAAVAVSRLRRHGRLASDGTRRATANEIATFCFGPDRPTEFVAALTSALDELVTAGRLRLVGSEYTWSASGRPPPRRSAPTGWEAVPVRREQVREHWVPPFLRRLHPGWRPRPEQLALYAEDLAAKVVRGPVVLPPGVTYVRGHPRGKHREVLAAAIRMVVTADTGRAPNPGELDELYDDWGADPARRRTGSEADR
jgi:hypothetical protein